MTDTSNVKEVIETTSQAEVNKLISLGWVLLATASGQWSDTQEAHIRYSLGWDKPLPSKK